MLTTKPRGAKGADIGREGTMAVEKINWRDSDYTWGLKRKDPGRVMTNTHALTRIKNRTTLYPREISQNM